MEYIEELILAMIISATPLEMKTGIPWAVLQQNINPLYAYLFCSLANVMAFPITIAFFEFLHSRLYTYRGYKHFSIKMARRAKNKTGDLVRKHGFWGIMVFVLIPLPLTGAYMGSIAAWIFQLPRQKAFASVAIGIMISGILVTLFTVAAQSGVHTLTS